jgi:porphobilinogen synthase
MLFPDYRARRMRQTSAFRRMVRETILTTDDLMLPLFAISGKNVKTPFRPCPDIFNCPRTTW